MARVCLFVAILAVIAIYSNALLSSEEKEAVWSRIKRVAPPKAISCATDNFPTTLTSCMKVKPDSLFNNSELMACNNNKKDDALFKWVKTYLLNTYQVSSKNNSIDWNATKTNNDIGPAACFVECLFRNFGNVIKPDGSLEFSYIATHFTINSSHAWYNNAELAVRVCSLSVPVYPKKDITITLKNKTKTTCSLAPLLAMQCAQNNMLSHIPSAINLATASCNTSKAVVAKCDLMPTMDFTGNK